MLQGLGNIINKGAKEIFKVNQPPDAREGRKGGVKGDIYTVNYTCTVLVLSRGR